MKKIKGPSLTPFLLVFVLWGCSHFSPSAPSSASSAKVKNIILMIGDGMGPQQISLADLYRQDSPLALRDLMNKGTVGLLMSQPFGALVPDSASSATQLGSGELSGSEMIGMTYKGEKAESILELSKKRGLATGLISDTRITHATPAAFAAHSSHRSDENILAEQMLETAPDLMLSGGARHFLPQDSLDPWVAKNLPSHIKPKSKRKDNRNLLKEASGRGYELLFSLDDLKKTSSSKVLGLFDSTSLPDALWMNRNLKNPDRKVPSLKEMTVKALEILSANPKGFFLMVEGGQIDWAAHANDAATLLHQMLQFDEAIAAAYEWAQKRDDTLLVVTADHETGSFGISYSKYHIPEFQSQMHKAAEAVHPNFNFGTQKVLQELSQQKTSFPEILSQFDSLPKQDQNAKSLQLLLNKNLPFEISLSEAQSVLEKEKNDFFLDGHEYLNEKEVPKIRDFKEYYVYNQEDRACLIGRLVSRKQQVVWGTGTHTSTPVVVMAYGPKEAAQQFSGFHHNTKVGQILKELVSP